MDWQAWKIALKLYTSTPELLGASFLAAIALFAFAWWLRGHWNKDRIDALEERLRLAHDRQNIVTEKLDEATTQAEQTQKLFGQIVGQISGSTLPVSAISKLIDQTDQLSGTIGDISLANLDLKQALSSPEEKRQQRQSLQMEVGESGPFFSTKGSGLYDIKRTFNIKVINAHPEKMASNCKIYVMKIEPQDEYEGPWSLKEISSLSSGEFVFIPLARYGEARNPTNFSCADTFFTTFLGSPGAPALDVGRQHIFTLRATANDFPMSEFRCKLWVDDKGRFRIEKV